MKKKMNYTAPETVKVVVMPNSSLLTISGGEVSVSAGTMTVNDEEDF